MLTSANNSLDDETEESVVEQRRKLNEFLANCTDLRKLEAMMGGFSLFRVLRFEEGEIRHSNVLAWLLDPLESHGLGDLFLKRLLINLKVQHLDASSVPDVIDIEVARFKSVEVTREWSDRRTRDRLDLLLVMTLENGRTWVIAVEIKVGSQQGKDQLSKYHEKVEQDYASAERRAYLFLTRDSEPPAEGSHFLGTNFGLVHTSLSACLDERRDLVASGPLGLMNDYKRLLETKFMPENEIQELARKIYREHRDALDLILSFRQDFVQAVSVRIEPVLKETLANEEFAVLKVTKGYVYLLPDAWKASQNTKSTKSDFPCLYCLVDFYNGSPVLRIVLDGGTEKFRDRVILMGSTSDFKRNNKKDYGKEWTSLHAESLSLPIKEEKFDTEADATDALLKKIKSKLLTDAMKARIETLAGVVQTYEEGDENKQ